MREPPAPDSHEPNWGEEQLRYAIEAAGPAVAMGWRRKEIILELMQEGRVMAVTVSAQELREALVQDGDQGTDPPPRPGIARPRHRRDTRPF